MSQHFVQLLFGDGETFTVSAVHHQDDDLKKTKKKQKTGHGVRINDLLVWKLLIWSETADKEWDIKPVL